MMPATSFKQKKLMDAVAHNPAFAKKTGIPTSVAKDFSESSKGMKFGKGSSSRADAQAINKPKTNQGKSELFKEGGNTMATKMNPGMMVMMAKKKAGAKKMAEGGMPMTMKDGKKVPAFAADGKGKMAKGGMASSKMGSVKTAAPSRDGVATKGKTKGKMVTMKSGGKAC
jgi:hypothetical protein